MPTNIPVEYAVPEGTTVVESWGACMLRYDADGTLAFEAQEPIPAVLLPSISAVVNAALNNEDA